jgi:hypothetical protein
MAAGRKHRDMDGTIPPSDPDPIEAALAAVRSQPFALKQLIRGWLDDWHASFAFWEYVQRRGGLREADWVFVADPARVLAILRDETSYSVREYDRRMRASSGRFLLGMDAAEHARNTGALRIIPSVNVWDDSPSPAPDEQQLAQLTRVAERAARALLARVGTGVQIGRLTQSELPCRIPIELLVAPVLDAAAESCFGIRGPSALSLVSWANQVTHYHFRLAADNESDRSSAQQASGQFRAHVLSSIAADANDTLRQRVTQLRKTLCPHDPGSVSDDDVARNLIGVLTGSLSATLKAFAEGLLAYAEQYDLAAPMRWPERPQPSAAWTIERAFPLYDRVIAEPLATRRRGSLDAIYRVYCGAQPALLGTINVQPGDKVVVWLGGTLEPRCPDNLFGVGMHKCPGMDMGKAIMEGTLCALSELTGAAAPRLLRADGQLLLQFDDVAALARLDRDVHVASTR